MKTLAVTFIWLLTSMNFCYEHYKYRTGTFPDTPVNMQSINTIYDDYNSALHIIGGTGPLCFSSNRNSSGDNYDIIYILLDVLMSGHTGVLIVDKSANEWVGLTCENVNLNDAVAKINTTKNELGPSLIPLGSFGGGYPCYTNSYLLLYANDESGNLDIKFTENATNHYYKDIKNVDFLNSDKDDAYPTVNIDSSAIYFCSNRDGDFDIYSAEIDKQNGLLTELNDTAARTITRISEVSSDYEDKCPFILGNLMLFTSNRPGGFGGFDLYYSTFVNGHWTEPVNLGDKINSESDEYRPVLSTHLENFTNDMLIFSSNRAGGKGGFDLYYAGINKMTGLNWY
jgi:hypothetical protein